MSTFGEAWVNGVRFTFSLDEQGVHAHSTLLGDALLAERVGDLLPIVEELPGLLRGLEVELRSAVYRQRGGRFFYTGRTTTDGRRAWEIWRVAALPKPATRIADIEREEEQSSFYRADATQRRAADRARWRVQ